MPPIAVVLALLVHGLAATGLWLWSPRQIEETTPEPVMVLFDNAPSNVGLQEPERSGAPPESVAAAPQPADGQEPAAQQQALAAPLPSSIAPSPKPSPAPQPGPPAPSGFPLYEFSMPPVPNPPPVTSRDFARPRIAAPVRPAQKPPPRTAPPSQYRPPPDTAAAMPAPLPGPTMADQLAGSGRQRNDYLTRLFRHLEPYRASARSGRAANLHGRVVTRVTIARNGSVLSISVDSSSGRAALDAAEVEAIRNGAPFPPIPAGMPGDPVILILRITY
jgi:periplasmic protein TonB